MKICTNKTMCQKYSKWALGGVGAFLFIYSGIQIQGYYQNKATLKASAVYDHMMVAMQKMDSEQARLEASTLIQHYRKTAYAPLGDLVLAKLAIEQSNLPIAVDHLRSALKGNEKTPIGQVTKVRLARVLASQTHYEDALALLSGTVLKGYLPLVEEAKGDIFRLQGEKDKAKKAYSAAIEAAPAGVSVVRIQVKLADIAVEGDA